MLRKFDSTDIEVLDGRYGPYITDGKKNARMPKDRTPDSLTLEEVQQLLAEAPAKKKGGRRGPARRSSKK